MLLTCIDRRTRKILELDLQNINEFGTIKDPVINGTQQDTFQHCTINGVGHMVHKSVFTSSDNNIEVDIEVDDLTDIHTFECQGIHGFENHSTGNLTECEKPLFIKGLYERNKILIENINQENKNQEDDSYVLKHNGILPYYEVVK